MSSQVEKAVEQLLRKALSSRTRENPIVKAVLLNAAPGSKGKDCDEFELSPSLTKEAIELLAQEIVSRAQEDADGMGGQQRYMLTLHEAGSKKSVARLPFRLRGMEDEFDDTSGEESPTIKGFAMQQMRHNESLVRMMVAGFGNQLQTMSRRLDSSEDHVERLLSQRSKDLEMLEEAKSTAHERDVELLRAEGSEKRKDDMFAKLALLMPAVLNKLAGTKVFNADDPMTMMLKGFVDSLSEDQFKQILGSLKPEQSILMVQLIQQLKTPPKALEAPKKEN